jgi:crotonobetainyl-CoA:carnitine CoA-transferase CaiB-like acyl-CoA transferase
VGAAPVTAERLPTALCIGSGYACRYAAWVLRSAGVDVRLAVTGRGPGASAWPDAGAVEVLDRGALARALATVDLCVTDVPSAVADAVGGPEPWPADLGRLVLVELGAPAADDDANAAVAAGSGIGAVIGEADGPGLPPPGRMLEAIVGLQAAAAALSGWLGARRDGTGERILVDPVECLAAMSGVNAIQFLDYGRRWRRSGPSASGSGGPFPFRLFRCADGWIVIICRSKQEWESIVDMLGRPEWSRLERFSDPLHIASHHADEAAALIGDILATRTVALVVEEARHHRVPLAPLRTIVDARADPRLFVDARADPRLFVDAEPVPAVTATRPAPRSVRWHARPAPRCRLGRAGPLAGLRVLDLGWVWAAPIAAAWLADLGADVVKVESMASLDLARRRGLEFPAGAGSSRATLPGYERAWLFNACNRNKRSVLLDLKDAADHERFMGLVERADVLTESFSAGVMERLGIAPEALLARNPHLIVVSMGGRTVDGEYVSRSYAPVLSALAGVEGLVTDRDGAPLGLLNWGVADPNAGAWAAFATVAAVVADAGGSHLLVSQLRSIVNTCLSAYRGTDPPATALDDPAEVTRAHLDGLADGPLGDLYRRVVTTDWSPGVGLRRAFVSPWRFRSMTVGVRAGAPTLGSTSVDRVCADWGVAPGAVPR